MSRAEFWRSVRRGFDSLTLGPTSPVLEELRRDAELRQRQARERLLNSWKPLPPPPGSAEPDGQVPA